MKWSKSDGVDLSSEAENFLNNVSQITDVDIHVTSGIRDEEKQVEVVCKNTIREDGKNLSVYSDEKERELYRTECQEGGDRNKIIEYLRNKGPKSHGTGNAIDIRSKGLSEFEISELTDALESEGASVLREFNPPHLHVDIKGGSKSLFAKKTDKLKVNVTDKIILDALYKIYEDTDECKITDEHTKNKNILFSNSFLEDLIKFC